MNSVRSTWLLTVTTYPCIIHRVDDACSGCSFRSAAPLAADVASLAPVGAPLMKGTVHRAGGGRAAARGAFPVVRTLAPFDRGGGPLAARLAPLARGIAERRGAMVAPRQQTTRWT